MMRSEDCKVFDENVMCILCGLVVFVWLGVVY